MAGLAAVMTAWFVVGKEKVASRLAGPDGERGASSLEYVAIAVGAIIIAGLIVAAVKAFVQTKIGQIGDGGTP